MDDGSVADDYAESQYINHNDIQNIVLSSIGEGKEGRKEGRKKERKKERKEK
jgi:hypothetical protein